MIAVWLISFPIILNRDVLLQEFPVWIDLEAPFVPVRSDDDLIVPLPFRSSSLFA